MSTRLIYVAKCAEQICFSSKNAEQNFRIRMRDNESKDELDHAGGFFIEKQGAYFRNSVAWASVPRTSLSRISSLMINIDPRPASLTA